MGNVVAIVGRPNVGKSTLFNRLTETQDAIVDSVSGVTRDRHYGKVDWNGSEFSLIDTGGYVTNSEDIFEKEIRKQVQLAIREADIILLIVDVTTGITDLDANIAEILRKSKKKLFLVVNKVDNSARLFDSGVFYSLGMGEIYNIASISGSGTGELLDDIVTALGKPGELEKFEIPKIAVVGKPNVGKSSLINALTGQERNIVTPIAGTTRDSVNTHYKAFGLDFILVDTAGIRKKEKVHENLEFYSVMRSIKAIEASDVCLLMIDATEGMQAQDVNIFHLAEKNRKGIAVVVNKWDLADKETNSVKLFEETIRSKTAPFRDYPIIFTSVITKQRLLKALETAMQVFENRKRRVATSILNKVMLKVIEDYPPPSLKGRQIKIKYITQLPPKYPVFAFFCNSPQYVKEPYKRYLENQLRAHFNFNGTPVQCYFRKK